ncbi:TPA: phage tail assembly protein [Yersinia enterocolitica]|uniref:phage tail assembly protein n=1 Tax=Yersinia enterocolitica TaxID=630 RepID=UPI0029AFB7C2|nr:phage tail assembly protein [Yersinia enterocolitica]EKN4824717.1 phage tail assembly protein [Yersinia enterocolitica]EKN5140501.1 phage tail assembly protein [Yersinia enterocolitica]ELW8140545.1 phage tail assembly protein [Yersinia enterocolitica]ELX2233663.1 phage tail assembly protein [Yersinia enterocolitica]
MGKEIVLNKPILAHGEKLSVLSLREPTFEEIEKHGIPFNYGGDGQLNVDTRIALKYLPDLAGIPHSSAKTLTPPDIFMASMLIFSFFSASKEESEESPT